MINSVATPLRMSHSCSSKKTHGNPTKRASIFGLSLSGHLALYAVSVKRRIKNKSFRKGLPEFLAKLPGHKFSQIKKAAKILAIFEKRLKVLQFHRIFAKIELIPSWYKEMKSQKLSIQDFIKIKRSRAAEKQDVQEYLKLCGTLYFSTSSVTTYDQLFDLETRRLVDQRAGYLLDLENQERKRRLECEEQDFVYKKHDFRNPAFRINQKAVISNYHAVGDVLIFDQELNVRDADYESKILLPTSNWFSSFNLNSLMVENHFDAPEKSKVVEVTGGRHQQENSHILCVEAYPVATFVLDISNIISNSKADVVQLRKFRKFS